MSTLSSVRGLTLIETAITLAVMTLITAAVAPAGMTMVQQAREVEVQRDCASLRQAIIQLLLDTNQSFLRVQQSRGPRVTLLVSKGDTPSGSDAAWLAEPDGVGTVDVLDNYLVENMPAGVSANAWPLPRRADSPGWRGAYLRGAPAHDPWGHRYAVNVQHLGTRNDVIVLSAGPDGRIDTAFTGRGLSGAGDDRYALVR